MFSIFSEPYYFEGYSPRSRFSPAFFDMGPSSERTRSATDIPGWRPGTNDPRFSRRSGFPHGWGANWGESEPSRRHSARPEPEAEPEHNRRRRHCASRSCGPEAEFCRRRQSGPESADPESRRRHCHARAEPEQTEPDLRRRHRHHRHHRRSTKPESPEVYAEQINTPWGTFVRYVVSDDADAEAEPETTEEVEEPVSDIEVVEMPESADEEVPHEVPKSPELGFSTSDVSDEEVLEAFRELKARVEAQEAAERAAEEAKARAVEARARALERKAAEEAAREEARQAEARQAALESALAEAAEMERREEERRQRREARKLEKRRHKEELKEELKAKHAKTTPEPFEVVEADLEPTFAKYTKLLDRIEERVERLSKEDLESQKKVRSFIALVESYYPMVDKVYLKLDGLSVSKENRKEKHEITSRSVALADRLDALLEKFKQAAAAMSESEAESDASSSSSSHRYTVTLEDVEDSDSN